VRNVPKKLLVALEKIAKSICHGIEIPYQTAYLVSSPGSLVVYTRIEVTDSELTADFTQVTDGSCEIQRK
jgi:hypothetical protein